MDPVSESIVYEEIENVLRESPISATWDGVMKLSTTDPRSLSWQRYKKRLSGAPSEKWVTENYIGDSELNVQEIGSESLIWRDVASQTLQTFNRLFPDVNAIDLNDKKCASVTVEEIANAYIEATDNDEMLKNSILIDVICDPIVKKLNARFNEKVSEVGKCCTTDWLRSKSKTVPLNDICGKRADLSGTTDWVMRRYGGGRRESSLYVSLMWQVTFFVSATSGKYDAKMAMDASIGMIPGPILDSITSIDGDRTTHAIDKTELANAVKNGTDKAPPAARVRLGIESVIAPRRLYTKKYNDLYTLVSSTADPKKITPAEYMKSRYCDGMFSSSAELVFTCDFGIAFKTMNGGIYVSSIEAIIHYNDLSDAVMDLKYKETHNYVICAKANSNYSFSDHSEALYVALTTLDEPCSIYNDKIKRRMCRYRFNSAVYYVLWPRYRAGDRGRRYVGTLSKNERNKLIQRGRKCIQGDVYIEENIWMDAICSNYNNRRAVIRNRGYTETLLYLLGVEANQSAKDHIHSAVKAIGLRPFDTGLELVTSLGSEWLAKLALRTVTGSSSYNNLVAELSDLLSTMANKTLPIISDHTITPCESICGSLYLRLVEMLTIVSGINTVAGEDIMSTVASVITMVSLDPFRCIAYQADMLLSD